MWIDTNGCEETMHVFKRVEGRMVCVHADDSECEEVEYQMEDAA